jgi:serine protease Do
MLSLGGRKIGGLDDYLAAAREVAAGEAVDIQLWRSGRTQTLTLRTREFPVELSDQLAWDLIGIRVEGLTPQNRREFRVEAKEGVVIRQVQPGSQLARVGVRAGDIVRQIDNASVATHEDFRKALARARQKTSFVLLVQRGDQGYYVTVSP